MLPMTSTIWAYNEFLTDGLFKNAEFPAGIDKDLVIDTIMIRNGELEPLYKNADFMQDACTSWARKWYHSFSRWYQALMEDYDPLHNYDRYEDITENRNDSVSSQNNTSSTGSGSIENENGSTTTNTRSSYDSSAYQPHDQTSVTGTSSAETTNSETINNSNSELANGNFTRSAHLYGNIGVTTSAQMLAGEIEIRKTTIYDLIADCFVTELCLLVY